MSWKYDTQSGNDVHKLETFRHDIVKGYTFRNNLTDQE